MATSSYRKDKTGSAQTAANASATVVAAAIQAGVISDMETARTEFDTLRGATFAELSKIVDLDNELFATVEAAAPAPRAANRGASKPGGGGSKGGAMLDITDPEEARKVALRFGKFAGPEVDGKKTEGVTLGELEAMTGAQTAEYGHGDGDKTGLSYLTWLSKNENNASIAHLANLILEDRKSKSAEA